MSKKKKKKKGKKIKILRFSVPKNEAVFREDSFGRKTIHFQAPMEQFAQQEYDEDVNVREHPESLLRKRIPKNIAYSVLNDPEDFHLKNGGVCILAEDAVYDEKKEEVVVTLSNFTGSYALHGVIDGFTTTAVVKDTVKRSLNSEKPVDFSESYVSVSVISGVTSRPEMARIAAARSTGTSVTDTTIANWDHEFDTLKTAMGDYKRAVGWPQNAEHKDPETGYGYKYVYSPNKILARLYIFHPNQGIMKSDGTRTGLRSCCIASSANGNMTEKYLNPNFKAGWKALLPLVPQILELWDYVESKFYEMYTDYNKEFGPVDSIFSLKNAQGGFVFWPVKNLTKATRGVRASKLVRAERRDLYFSNYTSQMPHIHDSFLFPFLSALRALLIQDADGTLRWSKDPKKFIDTNGKYLMETLFGLMENIQYDMTLMGKSPKSWKKMHVEVEKLLK